LHFHTFATLESRFTYQCPSSWPTVTGWHLEKNIEYWLVQINGNKFATGQILKKTGRSREGTDFSWLSSKVSQTLASTPLKWVENQMSNLVGGLTHFQSQAELKIWDSPYEGLGHHDIVN
jgi:hypothetical protein